ncbi:MAG: hypothetical protein DMF53_28425 [Acidobacteria bacterium]|nr:MAG: hypothetical protein DMF53_28425 [Acidobacteriota bacterium]
MADRERFLRLRSIFERVIEKTPSGQRLALSELRQDEPDLAAEAAALVAADAGASSFLAGFSQAVEATAAPPSLLGRRLGPYLIEGKLAEGGMSTVYTAVRTDLAYQQRVAVKIFSFSPDRSDLFNRFQSERQILASLSHPAIARLLDGGTTEEGLPYLVMELIEGVPVDQYCEQHHLTTGERVDLFLKICAAVAYAHRSLVVHRDLKPSNVLVDGEGNPKLLDFGIAKLLAGAPLPLESQATRTGERLMTPTYASPEQVTGGAITTATDVYSLGVLLYVLLAGRLPYRVAAERPGDLERAIVEQTPEAPSQAAPGRLRRALAGDLDNIVLTALRKEAPQRYAAVDLLAEDLRRYRQGLPVAAHPATFGYRLRKLVGRHPLAAGGNRLSGGGLPQLGRRGGAARQGRHRPRAARPRPGEGPDRARGPAGDPGHPRAHHRQSLPEPRPVRQRRASSPALAGAAAPAVWRDPSRGGREPRRLGRPLWAARRGRQSRGRRASRARHSSGVGRRAGDGRESQQSGAGPGG